MKKALILLKSIGLLIVVLLINFGCSKNTPSAQIVGSWKFTNIYVAEGTKAEIDKLPTLAASLPCVKSIVFIFTKSGDITGTAPTECVSTANGFIGASGVNNTIGRNTYEVKDNKLIIKGTNSLTFDVTFSGKTMIWQIDDVTNNIITKTRFLLEKQ